MSNNTANPYLGKDRAPFPTGRIGAINPYLGRDPNPFPINRIGSTNPKHQTARTQEEEPIRQEVKTEAIVVIAARARRRRRQTRRLQANGNQAAEA